MKEAELFLSNCQVRGRSKNLEKFRGLERKELVIMSKREARPWEGCPGANARQACRDCLIHGTTPGLNPDQAD